MIVAILAFKMPAGLALLSGTEGAVFGLFPIMWIVFNALWVYQLTVVSGRFEAPARIVDLDLGRPAHHGGADRVLLWRSARRRWRASAPLWRSPA